MAFHIWTGNFPRRVPRSRSSLSKARCVNFRWPLPDFAPLRALDEITSTELLHVESSRVSGLHQPGKGGVLVLEFNSNWVLTKFF